jgi:hypothetical protein
MSVKQVSAILYDWSGRDSVTLDDLSDDIVLKIFAIYVEETRSMDGWYALVHVCRKWRNFVFGASHYLTLQLVHTEKRQTKLLEVWPPLPVVIGGDYYAESGQDNLQAALKYNERICEIKLWSISSSLWERVKSETQVPFPTLTHLDLWFTYEITEPAPVIPDLFLGGSAPQLRRFFSKFASFPGLPRLLCSTHNLVELSLRRVPHFGYIPPETMVACLSRLTSLKELDLSFESPESCPDKESKPSTPPTRTPLPALTDLCFDGASDYLEDFVARIDAPLLNSMAIEFFYQVTFDTSQLAQFISRVPYFWARDEARVLFSDDKVSITLPGPFDQGLDLEVRCEELDLQLAFVTQACSSSFPQALINTVERLYIWYWPEGQPENIENSKWLGLLRPFTTLKGLYVSQGLVPCIAATLQELAKDSENMKDVLPALEQIFVEEYYLSESTQKAFEPFIAARQPSDPKIALSPWDGE